MITRSILGLSFTVAVALVAGACSSTPVASDRVCVGGDTESCTCDGGESGTRTCYDDGTGFSACDCSGSGGSGGSAGDGGDIGAAGSGGSGDGGGSGGSAGDGGQADGAAGDGGMPDGTAGDGGTPDSSVMDGGMDSSVGPDSSTMDSGSVCEGAAVDPTMIGACDACLLERCCDEMKACGSSSACSSVDDAGLTEPQCVVGCIPYLAGDAGSIQDAVDTCTDSCSVSAGPVSAATESLTACLLGGDSGVGCRTECGI